MEFVMYMYKIFRKYVMCTLWFLSIMYCMRIDTFIIKIRWMVP